MKSLRIIVHDVTVYEGEPMPVPRVGDAIHNDDQVVPVEGITWDFRDGDAVSVTLVLGTRPYTF